MNKKEIAELMTAIALTDKRHERNRSSDEVHRRDLEDIDLSKLVESKALYFQYDPKTRETNKHPSTIRSATFDLITEGTEDDPNVRRVSKLILEAIVEYPKRKVCLTGYVRNGLQTSSYFELLPDSEAK